MLVGWSLQASVESCAQLSGHYMLDTSRVNSVTVRHLQELEQGVSSLTTQVGLQCATCRSWSRVYPT
jgi:hypothetical protein